MSDVMKQAEKTAQRKHETAEPVEMIKVTLGQIGGRTVEAEIPAGTTAEAALKANNFTIREVRINRQSAKLSQVLKDGDMVAITPLDIEGGVTLS